MKILILSSLLLTANTATADLPVPDRDAKRIMANDMQMRIDSEYKRLYEKALSDTEGIHDENQRLKLELEALQRKQLYAPPAQGNTIYQPNKQRKKQRRSTTHSAPTQKLASGVQVFAVSAHASQALTVLPAGAWVRATLLTGVQANSRHPYNVLMQLDYAYTGPNDVKIPLNGCLMIGGATADLSIERVIIAPHTLSCVRADGEYVQRKVQGYVAGSDSSNGMTGVYDSKQSKVFLQAVLAGIVKGASEAYEIANTATTVVTGGDSLQTPVTNFKGKLSELAIARGIGKPAEMVTQWYLEQAKALLPTVHIGSGQDVWVVMTDKVNVPDLHNY